MSILDTVRNLWSGTPALEPVDAPGAPPPPPADPAPRGERTAAQVAGAVDYARGLGINLAYAGMVASGCRPDGRPVILPGNYATYREMARQPTIALGLAAADAACKVAWSWQANDDAPDGALEYIRDAIDPAQPLIVRDMLRSRVFGFAAFEKVFRPGGQPGRLKYLLPELTRIRYEERTGAFAGFRNLAGKVADGKPGVVLPLEYSFLYTHDKEGDNHYGRPLLENCREAYSYWLASVENKFRAQRKISGVIVQLHYPPGKSEVNGVSTDHSVIAQQILENVGKTNSVAMPNLWASEDRGVNTDTNGGKPQWILSTVDAGDGGSGLDAISNDARYWDTMMLRGLLVPERAVTEGQFGTKAEAEAHADILMTVGFEVAWDMCRAVNWYYVDDLLALRYGEAARGSVWAEPVPHADGTKLLYREIVAQLMTDPSIRTDIRLQIQLKAVLEKLGLPLAEGVDVDRTPTPPAQPATPPIVGEDWAGDGLGLSRANGHPRRGLLDTLLGDG